LSGSGKSTHTQTLVNEAGAVRLRSDVERKRLFAGNKEITGAINTGLYASDITRLTYAHLLRSAIPILQAGINVIIDATCLQRWQRDLFRDAAQEHGFSFLIIDFAADIHTLEQRILHRMQSRTDASEATIDVLHRQLQMQDRLDDDEQGQVFSFQENDTLAGQKLLQKIVEMQHEPTEGQVAITNGPTSAHKSTT
jgi:predicted kinase